MAYYVGALARIYKYEGEYLGTAELAEILGISKQGVSNKLKRKTLPEPIARLAMSPIWTKEQIEEYLNYV